MAPQNKFGFDGPANPPPEVAFEFWSLVFYVGMLALLVIKLDIANVPARISIAVFGAWAVVSSFCLIGLISTLGFADGSEAFVFAAASLVSIVLIAVTAIYGALSSMHSKQKHKHG